MNLTAKTSLLSLALAALCLSSRAQQIAPFPYADHATINYTRQWVAKAPQTDATKIVVGSSIDSFLMTTTYVDGLGRPLQTVAKQASPLGKDLVTPKVYNEFGQEQFQYLPFVANATEGNTSLSDGLFKVNAFRQDSTFSVGQYSSAVGQYNYGQSVIERSPLNRVLESFAPGDSWVGTSGQLLASDRKSVKTSYLYNTSDDQVVMWTAGTNPSDLPTSDGYYAAGELYKTVSTDEAGHQTVEYKDKEGLVILKKVQVDDSPGAAHSGWLCTYYVYDLLNNLVFVMQPKCVQTLLDNSSWTLTNTLRDNLCFYYGYDIYNRMIVKKVPGAGEVHMIYDQRDRLVMTQDAVQAGQNLWMVTLYDVLNRPVQTGLWSNSSSASYHASAAASSSNYYYPFDVSSIPSSGWERMTRTHYDDYSSLPSALSSTLNTSAYSGYFITSYNASPDYAQQLTASSNTRGMVTWTESEILNGSSPTYLSSVMIYDDKGRAIQTQSTNVSGGVDIASSQYDFSGKVIRNHILHHQVAATTQTYAVGTKNSFDAMGRVTKVEKNINAGGWKVISQDGYNELGQLAQKKLGEDPNSASTPKDPLETLNYDYNIRGWMLGVNRNYIKDDGATGYADHYFGFELDYDRSTSAMNGATYSNPQFNGNIAGTIWKARGDQVRRKYDYDYDNVNRITRADFNQNTASSSGGSWTNSYMNFVMKGYDADNSYRIKYDPNGNMLSSVLNGWTVGAGDMSLDALHYHYKTSSNQLDNVQDDYSDPSTTQGDFHNVSGGYATGDYAYDVNGSLTQDKNKAISEIDYNTLNLVKKVVVRNAANTADKGWVEYVYDASGNKLQKKVTEYSAGVVYSGTIYTSTIVTTTNYVGMFTYETKSYSNSSVSALAYTDQLQFLGQEEGRIRPQRDASGAITGFVYDYMIKDHLGNVRTVLTEEQKQDKYPVASLESSKLATEENYYSIDPSNIVNTSTDPITDLPTYTNDNGIGNNPSDASFEAANSQYIYKLNSNSAKIGLGITLKVMAGDRLDIWGDSFYNQNNTGGSSANVAPTVLELLTDFLGANGGIAGATAHSAVYPSTLNSISATTSGISTLLSDETTDNSSHTSVPKAYINYIFFDEQFKCIGHGFSGVGSNGLMKDHHSELTNLQALKNGYVYIYCSNESPVDVFFDNLQVVHTRNPLLEETQYYPFGSIISAISSKAVAFGEPDNHKKYNGIEKVEDLGIDVYAAFFRNLDQQTGRWWQIDPKIDDGYESISPYVSMNNNPIKNSDFFGDEASDECCPTLPLQPVPISPVGVSSSPTGGIPLGIVDFLIDVSDRISNPNGNLKKRIDELKAGELKEKMDIADAHNGKLIETIPLSDPRIVTTNKTESGTIYKVPGSETTSGKPYIGRHNKPNPQKTRKSSDGRNRKNAKVIDTYDSNDPQEGQFKEQKAIDNEGGVDKLDNKRNEVSPSRMQDLKNKYTKNGS